MNKKPHRLTIALDDEVYTKLKRLKKSLICQGGRYPPINIDIPLERKKDPLERF